MIWADIYSMLIKSNGLSNAFQAIKCHSSHSHNTLYHIIIIVKYYTFQIVINSVTMIIVLLFCIFNNCWIIMKILLHRTEQILYFFLFFSLNIYAKYYVSCFLYANENNKIENWWDCQQSVENRRIIISHLSIIWHSIDEKV